MGKTMPSCGVRCAKPVSLHTQRSFTVTSPAIGVSLRNQPGPATSWFWNASVWSHWADGLISRTALGGVHNELSVVPIIITKDMFAPYACRALGYILYALNKEPPSRQREKKGLTQAVHLFLKPRAHACEKNVGGKKARPSTKFC